MWVSAVDMLLERLLQIGFPFNRVAALSFSGQQHGCVFWRRGASHALSTLRKEETLAQQLRESFAISESPVWMDSSTSKQCQERERALGGPLAVAELSGSRAYERFSGNQIAKVASTAPRGLQDCERISLVSSFVATLFAGSYAGIDSSDASGMNLMDIHHKIWDRRLLDVTAERAILEQLLGPVVEPHSVVG